MYNGNSSLVEFKLRWIGDKNDTERRIQKDFDGMDQREFFYDYERSDGNGGLAENRSSNGYKFNKEV